MGAFVYIVRCSNGHYYTGSTRADLEKRISEHNEGSFEGYTSTRRPVELVYSQYFDQIAEAIEASAESRDGVAPRKKP